MALTDLSIRTAKPEGKARKLFDTRGLFLLVSPTGSKLWRMKYRHQGKEKLLALGRYPDVSLAQARTQRDEARKALASSIDPSEARKASRRDADLSRQNSLEAIAREWHEKRKTTWVPEHATRLLSRLEQHVFPWVGDRAVNELRAPDILPVLQRMEQLASSNQHTAP